MVQDGTGGVDDVHVIARRKTDPTPALTAAGIDRREHRPLAAVVGTFLLLFVWAVWFDRTPAHWDGARNLLRSDAMRTMFRHGRLGQLAETYLYYPNGEFWLVGAVLSFGRTSYRLALLTNAVWIVALTGALVALGQQSGLRRSGRTVLIAIVLGSPMVLGQARELLLDVPMLTAFVVVIVSILRVPERPASTAWLRPFTMMLLALLLKWSVVPWIVGALIGELVWRRRTSRAMVSSAGGRGATFPTMVGFVSALGLCLLWYVPNRLALVWDIVHKGIGAGLMEGDPQGIGWHSLRFYLRAIPLAYAWLPTIVLAVLTAAAWAVTGPKRRRNDVHIDDRLAESIAPTFAPQRLRCILVAVVLVNVPYLLWQSNKDTRYLLPMLVPIAVLVASGVERSGWFRSWITRGFVGAAIVNAVTLTLPLTSWSLSLTPGLPVIGNAGYTATRPTDRMWVHDRVLAEARHRETATQCGRSMGVWDRTAKLRVNERTFEAQFLEAGWERVQVPGTACVGILLVGPGATPERAAAELGLPTMPWRTAFPDRESGLTVWVVSRLP
jgi:hypothetical protein